jgi:hypothetical protein
MFALRYKVDAPIQPRPHRPCVPKFETRDEAVAHLEEQDNSYDLEVVER